MESASTSNRILVPKTHPKPLLELLPDLRGILTKDDIATLSAKKKPRPRVTTASTEKSFKIMTIAELRANKLLFKNDSPKLQKKAATSTKKKIWNSSVKLDHKTASHTANGQMKNNPVRKVLDFQTKPRVLPQQSHQSTETPKFQKPGFLAKKTLPIREKTNANISGINHIPPTPLTLEPKKVMKMSTNNKENTPLIRKNMKVLPPVFNMKPRPKIIVETPTSNLSWKSDDASFIKREKEIQEVEDRVNAVLEEPTLENIAEVSPPISTPFKEYRSIQEYFSNSSHMEILDNTIICLEKTSGENSKKEESLIMSLCDLFDRATVTNREQQENSDLHNLLEVKKQLENNIKTIDTTLNLLNNVRLTQLKSLQNIITIIEEKKKCETQSAAINRTLVELNVINDEQSTQPSPEKSPVSSRPCSVIKSNVKAPMYKIPKKNSSLRIKAACKSMPNVCTAIETPVKDKNNRALSMYMDIKKQMNFLNTPKVSRVPSVPDTPGVTSNNLQQQLDRLFGGS